MAATKQEQIDRLKKQLKDAQATACEAAQTHAATVLGDKIANILEFQGAHHDDEGENATRWYRYDVPFGLNSKIGEVQIAVDGRVEVRAFDLPLPVDQVRGLLESALDVKEEGCTCDSTDFDDFGYRVHWASCQLRA